MTIKQDYSNMKKQHDKNFNNFMKRIVTINNEYSQKVKELIAKHFANIDNLNYNEVIKYKKFDKFELELNKLIREMRNEYKRVIKAGFIESYVLAYVYNAFILEINSLFNLRYPQVADKKVNNYYNEMVEGLTTDERLNRDANLLAFNSIRLIKAVLSKRDTKGNIINTSIKAMYSQFKQANKRYRNNTVLIADNKYDSGFSYGQNDSDTIAKDRGLEIKKLWVSTGDFRTRKDHVRADNKEADKNGNFHVGNSVGPQPRMLVGSDSAKQNIRCRCTTRNEIVGFEPKLRRYRDEGIQDFKTIEDWRKSRGFKI